MAKSRVPLYPPDRLVRTVTAWEGEAGREWLVTLPDLVREYLDRWELVAERVHQPGGQISMVVLVRRSDGTPAVLKLSMITTETRHEHAALAHWGGRGAVRLLRSDPERGVLLLERLQANVSLRSLPEPTAMLEAAEVALRLWVPPAEGHPFVSVADYTAYLVKVLRERRERPWAADARPLVDDALRRREALVEDEPEQVLLHGDFHHGNVLSGRGTAGGGEARMSWLAIDPKPLVGERAYDLAWLARDRLETLVASPGAPAAARRRLTKLADSLDVDRDRLSGWALFRAVEAGVWCFSVGDRVGGELLLEFASWF